MFLFGIAAIAGVILALRALFHTRRLRADLAGLTEQVSGLDRRLVRLADDVGLLRGTSRPDEAAPEPAVAEPIVPLEPAAAPAEPPAPPEEPTLAPAAVGPQPMAVPGRGWEQKLVEHWLVWVGGAAMALGGAFLVKLSIDQGLLTPLVRVVLGILLGIAMSIGAEWVRRHDNPPDTEAAESGLGAASYVPQALAAAGAATIFASLYAAHALYGFLPAGLAFPLLAATAGATVAQSLRLGPLVAALGLVGAFVVPLLVTSTTPHALPLFAYLAVGPPARWRYCGTARGGGSPGRRSPARFCGWRCGWRARPISRRRSSRSICWPSSGCSSPYGAGSPGSGFSPGLPTAESCGW